MKICNSILALSVCTSLFSITANQIRVQPDM